MTSCLDEKLKLEYFIFVKSSSSENPIIIKCGMDNTTKEDYTIKNLQSGYSYVKVSDYTYHLKHPVYDCEISVLNETDSTLQLYAMWENSDLSINGKYVDLKDIWAHAESGENVDGIITVDSVFNYLKNTNDKRYFEIPPAIGKYYTFQMSDFW